ncbi:hypothetical protein BK133_09430 [Paenibacillus sp. FSL H8-0548]|uniref:hypothetical protein n=1 Tax=Paenibacillus sp. FSL H8-0548 TaxID=1920422 RepID=UPI00096C6CD6|nr:hypothetical protein [Paenibacillus sp. FSL H8-0548]OMF35906.1 hypothetical protein BK133_09430 [Paenibacillus sp. FSL H8-0548]
MVDEFEFFRKVRAYYNNVPFLVQFTYRLSHRVDKAVTARGSFSCRVNPHTQIVEYVLELKSDIISRPYSEHSSLLFSSIYEEITAQTIELTEFPIQSLKYPIPIEYDWQDFVKSGAEDAINAHTIQQLFKKWRMKGTSGKLIDGNLKVEHVLLQWQL